jgi:DNA-binding CsgD family transcriptional regulator
MSRGVEPRALRPRQFLPGDGVACARLMLKVTPMDRGLGNALPEVLDRLIKEERLIGGIIEEFDAGSEAWRMAGLSMSAFVAPEFRASYIQNPYPCLTSSLLVRCMRGECDVFLDRLDQASGNLGQGLDQVMLDYHQDPMDWTSPEGRRIMTTFFPFFLQAHRGYNINSMMVEAGLPYEPMAVGAGYRLVHCMSMGESDASIVLPRGASGERALFSVTREEAERLPPSSPISALFTYHPPKFRFTPAEQRVLARAIEGLTDDEIAAALGVSRDAVKQLWRSIYDHAMTVMPELINRNGPSEAAGARGQEKRRRITSYVRDNAQELRPHYSRRG